MALIKLMMLNVLCEDRRKKRKKKIKRSDLLLICFVFIFVETFIFLS